jgi:5-(carboxyamino)imidazole ribonucleotide mutase
MPRAATRAPTRAATSSVPRTTPIVGIIMGSRSDLETMRHSADILDALAIPYEILVVSAHRTPDWLFTYAKSAESRGIEVVIAGAGGAAHLPGMCASQTCVPVLGVPVESRTLKGLDSLLSIAQMPGGIPVGTLAIGKAGATNAGLLAASIVSITRPTLRRKLQAWRAQQTNTVLNARELESELKRTRRQLNLAAKKSR